MSPISPIEVLRVEIKDLQGKAKSQNPDPTWFCDWMMQFVRTLAEIPGGVELLEERGDFVLRETSGNTPYCRARSVSLRRLQCLRPKRPQPFSVLDLATRKPAVRVVDDPLRKLQNASDVKKWKREVAGEIGKILAAQSTSRRTLHARELLADSALSEWRLEAMLICTKASMLEADGARLLLGLYRDGRDYDEVLLAPNLYLKSVQAAAEAIAEALERCPTANAPGAAENAPERKLPAKFAALLEWASRRLKGMERRVIELAAQNHGVLPLADVASDPAIEWEVPYDNPWNSLVKRVNRKLIADKFPFKLARVDNEARLVEIGSKKT